MQDWWDWDGIGQYKSRRHGYPVNMMLRDVQKRRSFEKHNEVKILQYYKIHSVNEYILNQKVDMLIYIRRANSLNCIAVVHKLRGQNFGLF